MTRLESLIKRKERFISNVNRQINEETKKQWSLDNGGVEVGDYFYLENKWEGKRKCLLLDLIYEHNTEYELSVQPIYKLYSKDGLRLNKKTIAWMMGPYKITRIGKSKMNLDYHIW